MNNDKDKVISRIKEDLSLLDKEETFEIVIDLSKEEKDVEHE